MEDLKIFIEHFTETVVPLKFGYVAVRETLEKLYNKWRLQ